jgi:hypothetical protein
VSELARSESIRESLAQLEESQRETEDRLREISEQLARMYVGSRRPRNLDYQVDAIWESEPLIESRITQASQASRLTSLYGLILLIITVASLIGVLVNLPSHTPTAVEALVASALGAVLVAVSSWYFTFALVRRERQGLIEAQFGLTAHRGKESQFLTSWAEIERLLREKSRKTAKGRYEPLAETIERLRAANVLPDEAQEQFRFLAKLRNTVAHEAHTLNDAEFALATAYADDLLDRLRAFQKGRRESVVDVLLGERALMNAFEAMRARDPVEIRAIWSARYHGVESYFEREKIELASRPYLRIKRLVNPIVLDRMAAQTLHSLTRTFPSQTDIRMTDIYAFECYLCSYEEPETGSASAGVLVLNGTGREGTDPEASNPEVGIWLDDSRDVRLKPVLAALEQWFDDLWATAAPLYVD